MTRVPEVAWTELDRRLRAYFRRRVADPSRVDDLVQDTLSRMLTGLSTLRDQDAVMPWAYRVARSTLVDHVRRHRPAEPFDDQVPEAPTEDEDEAAGTVAAWLLPMLHALSPADREALTLTEIEGLSQVEVARRLGLSPSGARTRVQRARRRLRKTLEDCCRIDVDRRGKVVGYERRGACCDGPC